MSGTSVLRIIQLFDPSAIMRLDIAKLPKHASAGWALPGLRVLATCKITQAVNSSTTSAF
jgi:hypothetical protein